MAFSIAVFFLLVAAVSSPASSSAATPVFNVTQLLARFPDYSNLNSLLSSTRVSDRTAGERSVADWINEKRTITILCPPNGVISAAISSLGGTPSSQTIANVLSYHVLLDYYDASKLGAIANGTTLVTTLFQEAGPPGNDGFLNITIVDGVPKCGRPIQGSPLTATINGDIYLQPYDISLLGIDSVLVPLDATAAPPPSSSPPSAPSPSPASASPSPSPSAPSPSPASSSASAPAPASVPPTPPSPSPSEPASPPIANPPSSSPSPSAPAQPPSPPSFAAPVFGDRLFMVLIGLAAVMLFM